MQDMKSIQDDFLMRPTVTVEEMREYYGKNYPLEPSNQRIGRFAKSVGYVLTKQMRNRKYERFYIKKELLK